MFVAYLPDSTGACTVMLKPVVSDPVFNPIRTWEMTPTVGSVRGGEEVHLICDNAHLNDIQVCFSHTSDDSTELYWVAIETFPQIDMRQHVFKTSAYKKQQINTPVNVLVYLRRKSVGIVSKSRSFKYVPSMSLEKVSIPLEKAPTHFSENTKYVEKKFLQSR